MRIDELQPTVVAMRLAAPGLTISVGPFSVRFQSALPAVADYVRSHYGAFPLLDQNGCHLAIDIEPARGLRRFIRRQAVFRGDGVEPFYPLPQDKAPALLEWGFNWCIGRRVHHLVVVHSAVVARDGRAALLPAPPESGKSTLCAALVAHGWRLCSDEFALVDPVTSQIFPLPRPISLKKRSIEIIGGRMRGARFGPEVTDIEGTRTRYLAPPAESVALAANVVRAAWIVVPKYVPEAKTAFETVTHARMLAHLADSSYNYNALGPTGFNALARLADASTCHKLTYSNLDEALALFDELAAGPHEAPGT
jgi:HprK-related kinase A